MSPVVSLGRRVTNANFKRIWDGKINKILSGLTDKVSAFCKNDPF